MKNEYNEDGWGVEYVENSKNIRTIAYNKNLSLLQIEFIHDNHYEYYHVAEDVWTKFYDAESKGKYFHEHIKGKYEFEKMKVNA